MNETLSKGERTNQAILEAAYSLFLEQGFHGTSMRQIARRAGLALGGIYNHFESKEQIFDQVLLAKHPYRQVLDILQAAPGDTMEEFAKNAARIIEEELGRRPDFLKLALIEITEFKGQHIPMMAQMIFPRLYPLLQRFAERQAELRDRPMPMILLAFLGTFLAYFISRYIYAPSGLVDVSEIELSDYLDIFLHGVLKPAATPPAAHQPAPSADIP